jgi:hypothetical protein
MELKQLYTIVKNNFTKLAEKMPEEHYGFKAAPEIGAFGQLIAHVAEANPQLHDGEWQSQGDQSQHPNRQGRIGRRAEGVLRRLRCSLRRADRCEGQRYDRYMGSHLANGESWDKFGTKIVSMRFISVHFGSMSARTAIRRLVGTMGFGVRAFGSGLEFPSLCRIIHRDVTDTIPDRVQSGRV